MIIKYVPQCRKCQHELVVEETHLVNKSERYLVEINEGRCPQCHTKYVWENACTCGEA